MQFALSDRTRCRSESLNAELFGTSYFPPPSLSRWMFSRANKKLSLHTFLSWSGGGMARAEKNSKNSSSGNMKRKVPLASYSLGKYSIFQLFAPTFPSSVAFFSARNGNFLSFSPSCINFSFDRRSLRKAFIFLSFIWFRLDLLERRRRRFGCLSSHIYMSRISSFTRSTRIFMNPLRGRFVDGRRRRAIPSRRRCVVCARMKSSFYDIVSYFISSSSSSGFYDIIT